MNGGTYAVAADGALSLAVAKAGALTAGGDEVFVRESIPAPGEPNGNVIWQIAPGQQPQSFSAGMFVDSSVVANGAFVWGYHVWPEAIACDGQNSSEPGCNPLWGGVRIHDANGTRDLLSRRQPAPSAVGRVGSEFLAIVGDELVRALPDGGPQPLLSGVAGSTLVQDGDSVVVGRFSLERVPLDGGPHQILDTSPMLSYRSVGVTEAGVWFLRDNTLRFVAR